MKFSRITLQNWRNFKQVDVSLQNRVFLIGPNASGKSNFLDAFRFLRDIATIGLQQAVETRKGITRIRNLTARHPTTDIKICVELSEEETPKWKYLIALTQDNRRRPQVKEEKVWRSDQLIVNRPDEPDIQDKERLKQTHLEQTIVNQTFREIAEFFSTVHYYHLVPQLIREPERSKGIHADPYGGDFLTRIAETPKNTREARLRRIQSALKVAVPQLSQLKLEKDEQGIAHLYGNYEHWRPTGAWQTEADFSDGTLRLLGLFWSLLDGSGPVLLEEPELSLHPEIVRHIPQMMHRVQHGRKRPFRQILLSTHSSDLLRDEGIAADEVLLFIPAKEGSEVRIGAEIAEVNYLLEAGLTVAEAALPQTKPPNAMQLSLFSE